MVPTLWLFDRWDERIGTLPTLGSMTHTEELGGEDTIELDCLVAPEKGDRLVWWDAEGRCWRDYVEEVQLVSKTAEQAMRAVLAGTRWRLGSVGVGDAKRGALLYHANALAALRRVEAVWGGELECSLVVTDSGVAVRSVSLLARRGGRHGARFSYGRNLVGCTRTVLEDEVCTALYGWGKGLPIEDESGKATGGYTRRLSFADVNGGVKWVGDEDARARWGRWDADRSERVHAFGDVVFPECEDPAELLALTKAELARRSHPRVSYECDVAMLDGGVPVGLGDDVAVVDTSHAPEWRLTARCVRRVRTFGAGRPRVHVTLGSVERATWEASAEIVQRVTAVEETAAKASDTVQAFDDLGAKEY